MDKQKQIEEMARIIAFDLCPNRNQHIRWGEKAQCYSDNNFAECTKIKNVVDKLFNAGYRKIPENAVVVLTREELEKIKGFSREEVDEISETAIKNSRKETAEKFAEMVDETIAKRQGERDGYEAYQIDDKARYDGDIISLALYKICKEITEGK